MTDSAEEPRLSHAGAGLMEFTYRFLTVMLDRDLMTVDDAVEFNIAVGNALEFGRQTPGAITALQDAIESAERRRISSLRS